jgi:hypothetical protein
MALDDATLSRQALMRYERGRLIAGLRSSAWLSLPVACALWGCTTPWATAAAGLATLALMTWMRWRGDAYLPALRAGVAGGLVPFSFALAVRLSGGPCSTELSPAPLFAAVGGGLVAGAIAGTTLAVRTEKRAVLAALLLAGLIGALGCIALGVGLVIGMGTAVLGCGVPMYFAAHARRS